jgi:DeoR/GlpR family transcriptional regulator of sugar metabolism
MQIFLSHSSKQKPLIREIKRHLPDYLGSWIDEERLLFGDNVSRSLEATIKSETDYLLLFIDSSAAQSAWVAKELEWTLQAEKNHGRTILLPIVIEEDAWKNIQNPEVQGRKYLLLRDFLESSVRSLAQSITTELFALVCRDISRLRKRQTTPSTALADADTLLRSQAALIEKAVFPHRRSNPVSRETLREVINAQCEPPIEPADFEAVLSSISQRNLIPGLFYDGFELYLVEEHASWKGEVHKAKKERVARRTAMLIQNGIKLCLDAGSTTEEIVRILCRKIENRAIKRITIATTSVNIADMISDCCVAMGFDDEFSAVRLYIPGGQIRPSTQAIVAVEGANQSPVLQLCEQLGQFDLGIVGVNGVDLSGGFTTHENAEAANKAAILASSKSSIIVGDSSKIGLVLERKFADFTDSVRFVVDDEPTNQKLGEIVALHRDKILLA